MERTESFIIEMAPNYENAKIKQMEMFGWNLQGRQEIMGHLMEAKTPDSLFVAMWRGGMEGATGKKYYEYDHYVKLHFVRSLNLPNLSKIKNLETECSNLPYPETSAIKSFIWPLGLILVGLMSLTKPAGVGAFLIAGGGGGWWFYSKVKKRQENRAICEQSVKKHGELINQLESLNQKAIREKDGR